MEAHRVMVTKMPKEPEFVEVEYRVEANYAGWRLDEYLCEKIPRLSRARVQRIIRHGLIADRKLKPATRVYGGMCFRLRRTKNIEPATPTDVGVLHDDAWLLVLDKPAGLPVHPTARYHAGTLTQILKDTLSPQAPADPVHRLDRETSGVIVCGRGPEVCRTLMRAFVAGAVRKQYLAVCEGWPQEDAFAVDAPIAEGTEAIRIAVRIDAALGKPARTRFEVERRFERDGARFALLRAFPETGRQHQIRIHLHHLGFPLVGDKMYGPDAGYFDRFSKHALEPEAWVRLRLPRHALHAAEIELLHPGTGAPVRFSSPLPADLRAFLAPGTDAADGVPVDPKVEVHPAPV